MNRNNKIDNIKSIEDSYILGYLATDEKNFPIIGEEQEAVTYLKKSPDYIIFYIKAISNMPPRLYEIPGPWDNNLFIGFEKALECIQMPPDYWYLQNVEEKKQSILNKLRNKLILFKPYIKKEEKNSKNEIYYRNLVIHDVEDAVIEQGKKYVAIPSPDMSLIELERSMIQQIKIDFPYYSKEMVNPEIILCEDYLYCNVKWGNNGGNRIVQSLGDIKKIPLSDNFYENVIYKVNDNLLFVDEDYYNTELPRVSNKEGANIFNTGLIKQNKEIIKSEWEFLENFKATVISSGLCYEDIDLYNFHISVKTNPLTIISGMAGTGKTRLAISYAKALGLDENHYTVIPISPAYTEPSDIIGYLNTSKGEYIPSETGIVDILKRAQDNRDEMFMIIFDEMNLSQVEYWFSPFISLLEMDAEERNLILYNKNSECSNSKKYPSIINIKSNILFVGTVNIDETTKNFSDRLLDRANLITPHKVSFVEMRDILKNKRKYQKSDNVYNQTSFMDLWRRNVDIPTDVFKEIELDFLDKMHRCINNVDKQKGVSYRTLQHIADYILNIPESNNSNIIMGRGTAFDIQVKQRILTKIKGHQEQYGKLIGVIDKGEIGESELYNLLKSDAALQISDFKYSIDELKRKAEEMYYNGYSS